MIQYDRLTMVKQLHANTLRPIVGGVIAQNAMPPGGEGSAPSTSRKSDRAVAIQLQRERGVAGGFADAAEVVKHRRRELDQAGVASFTEHPAVLILPVKSNAASGVCSAIKKRSL